MVVGQQWLYLARAPLRHLGRANLRASRVPALSKVEVQIGGSDGASPSLGRRCS